MPLAPDPASTRAPATRGSDARRLWQQAAFRQGLVFILFPAIVPLPLITTFGWFPHSLAATVAVSVAWIVLVACSIGYGCLRIRRYKREHPFVG